MKLKLRKQTRQEERDVPPKNKTEGSPTSVSEEYTRLPIRQCEPHPDVVMRLDHGEGIEGLSDSIRTNGQQVPGMAVERPDGSGFWIIAGNRRLQACKLLFGKYGEPSSYKAILFHGLSKEEIYSKAIIENESERGERKNLSAVEELAFLFSIRESLGNEAVVRIGVRAGKNEQSIRKKLSTAEELGREPMLKNLFKIENKCATSFKLSHLEALSKHGYDQELLLQIAAIAAASKMSPEEIDPKASSNLLRYIAPWFYDLFPELNPKQVPVSGSRKPNPEEGSQSTMGTDENSPRQPKPNLKQNTDENNASPKKDGERVDEITGEPADATSPGSTQVSIMAQGIFFARCPVCSSDCPFDASGLENIERKIELSFYDLDKKKMEEAGGAEKNTVTPTIILVAPVQCAKCLNEFWVNLSPRGHGTLAIESFKEKTFAEPIETQKECTLAYDNRLAQGDGWVVISGETKYLYKEGRRLEISGGET